MEDENAKKIFNAIILKFLVKLTAKKKYQTVYQTELSSIF